MRLLFDSLQRLDELHVDDFVFLSLSYLCQFELVVCQLLEIESRKYFLWKSNHYIHLNDWIEYAMIKDETIQLDGLMNKSEYSFSTSNEQMHPFIDHWFVRWLHTKIYELK